MIDIDLYLASASPRRKELLTQVGVIFERIAAPVDETPLPGENPRDYVLRLAHDKAESGWAAMVKQGLPVRPVLAADTTVVLGEYILGKPENATDATRMLRDLSGSSHEVLTSLGLRHAGGVEVALSVSVVHFAKLTEAQIAAYVASGEPMDKAGAYGIQGGGGLFVSRLEGSFTGVMGLPLHETAVLLGKYGMGLLAL
ncbi:MULTISPECIES: Maf family protein [Silvimonas]|uniref:Maf family protein n=1 Tax=Silvimonas TaxID=300264 RepID=UPI0024B346CC|nr:MULTISPECIES: nucleoside triphosphate pyrophosphatase [Silvimonas]MDR3429536.1 Maf family protein [Silvimonas sp.]